MALPVLEAPTRLLRDRGCVARLSRTDDLEFDAAVLLPALVGRVVTEIAADQALRLEPVEGVKNGEPALIVTSPSGPISVLVSDVLMNSRPESLGFLPRLMGFSGAVKIVPVFRMMFLADKKALRSQIDRWASLSGLARLIPCHGDVASAGVPEALQAAAATL